MNIDLIPNGAIKRVHVSQNDVGRTLTFELFNNSAHYNIPSGAVIKIQGTKPNGLGFSETCTVNNNLVTVDTTEAMTEVSGNIPTELSISYGDVVIGTSNFVLAVEKNPHPDGTVDGTGDNPVIENLEVIITNAVDAWLDEHPEATTTVVDGSLTEAKFSESLKLETIKDYVTPEMFGAVGDGVTDDTLSLQDAINHAISNDISLRLTDNKVYGISTGLIIENGWIEVTKSTGIIKALSALDGAVISIKSPNIITDRSEIGTRRKISVNLDCNGSAIGIYCKQIFEYVFHDSLIEGAIKGIQVDSPGAEVVFENCYIDGTGIANSVGVENNASDIRYQGVYMFNCHIAFDVTAFCEISDCHPWMDRNIDGSIGLRTTATCRVFDSYIDTYQKSIYKANDTNLLLDNCYVNISGEFYSSDLGDAIIFYGEGATNYNYSLLSNLFIVGSSGLSIKLSNINPFNVPLVNSRIEYMIDKTMQTSTTGFVSNNAPLQSVESGITINEQATAENTYARHIYLMLTATSAKSAFTDLGTLRSQYAPKYTAQIMGMSTLDQKACLFYIFNTGKIQPSKAIAVNETYRISGIIIK